jgi:hypothetical protein
MTHSLASLARTVWATAILIGALAAAATPANSATPVISRAELPSARSETSQPSGPPFPTHVMAITGLQSALFGMTPDAVRAAAAKDFGPGLADALAPAAVEPGLTAIGASGTGLPYVGSGRILYVFGPDGRLCAIDLEKTATGPASARQRADLLDIARKTAEGFESARWKPFTLIRGRPVGLNDLVLFHGADDLGNGVEIELFGVDYVASLPNGAARRSPQAQGPAALRILFRQDIDGLAVLKPGDFAEAGGDHIDGFRHARFGDTEAQVLSALTQDFGTAPAGIERQTSKDGTFALVIGATRLNPGPGPAAVSYIFDGASQKLIHVNVGWITPSPPTDAQRQATLWASDRLVDYFHKRQPALKIVAQGRVADPHAMVAYEASDDRGASVTVTVEGVPLTYRPEGAAPKPAALAPLTPAVLVISYGPPSASLAK